MHRSTTHWLLVLFALLTGRAPAAEPPSELVWQDRFDLAGHRDGVRRAIVSDGYLIVDGLSFLDKGPNGGRERGTHVSAYDFETGELVWRQLFSASGADAVYVDRGLVILIGWVDFSLRIWTFELETGEPRWEASGPPVESEISRSALVDGVLFSAGQWRPGALPEFGVLIQARDAQTGTLLWEERSATSGAASVLGLAVQNGLAAVLSREGLQAGASVITGYDAATGERLWSESFDAVSERIDLEAAICRGRLFVASSRRERASGPHPTLLISARSALTGRLLWQRELESSDGTTHNALGLHCAGPNVFLTASSGSRNDQRDDVLSLVALARGRGAVRWRHDFEGDPIFGHFVQFEKGSVLFRVDDELRVYSRRKGKLAWATNPFPKGFWLDADVAPNGWLAVAAGIREGGTKADAVVRVLR